jgi:hypothetical protein
MCGRRSIRASIADPNGAKTVRAHFSPKIADNERGSALDWESQKPEKNGRMFGAPIFRVWDVYFDVS